MDTFNSHNSGPRATFVPLTGWMPADLPELSTKGFPFAQPFVLEGIRQPPSKAKPAAGATTPFGLSFRNWPNPDGEPPLNLEGAFYDPHTQVNVLPGPASFYTAQSFVPTERKWVSGYTRCMLWTSYDSCGTYDTAYDPLTDRESDYNPD